MNGDLSLSQSLGGLRIANPDAPGSPVSAPARDEEQVSLRRPRNYLAHSSSFNSNRQGPPLLEPIQDSPTDSYTLDFDPNTFSAYGPSGSLSSHRSPRLHTEHSSFAGEVSPRQSGPQGQSAPESNPYASHASIFNHARSYAPAAGAFNTPVSGIYTHPNGSTTSAASSKGSYWLRDEHAQSSKPRVNRTRTNSRVSAGGIPAGRSGSDSGREDRGYRQSTQVPCNGPLPQRRSSKGRTETNAGDNIPYGGIHPEPSAYGEEGGPLPSSEEWKERGAAISVKQDVDASGRSVSKVVKKGVKDFTFGRTLGEGSYSTVLAATDRQTHREYAIKVLDKRHIIKEKKVKYVNIEKDTLNRLTEHPGIVRLYYTFQDERSLYFVLDLASGGELLGVLKKMTTFDEECTRFYGAQILDAIDYMHSRGVIHRDLKPENVLLNDKMHVKITDFGTAKILDTRIPAQNTNAPNGTTAGNPMDGVETDRAVSFVGTAEYVSPELLTDKNACKASDLWAFGCIIYQLLAGRPPFKAGNEYQTFQKIVKLEYSFPEGFPEQARDLVQRLLVLEPSRRLSVEHIKSHPFFRGIQWGKGLWKQRAPRLKSYAPPDKAPIKLNGNGDSGSPDTPVHIGSKSAIPGTALPASSQPRPQPRVITELPPPSQLDIEWSPVLTRNNERILKLGNLIVTATSAPHSPNSKGGDGVGDGSSKLARFFGASATKKRQRLVMITSSGRIIIVAAGGDEKKTKMEVPLLGTGATWRSYKDPKGLTAWCVDTKEKHFTFEDPKATTSDPEGSAYSTQEWLDAVDRANEIAMSQTLTNSYSNDSTFNDLNSSFSSPASAGTEGATSHETAHTGRNILRKDYAADNDSIKAKKRFSKRQSKGGLAAVF